MGYSLTVNDRATHDTEYSDLEVRAGGFGGLLAAGGKGLLTGGALSLLTGLLTGGGSGGDSK